jgi:type IV secretory pathway TrbL component
MKQFLKELYWPRALAVLWLAFVVVALGVWAPYFLAGVVIGGATAGALWEVSR